MTREQIAKHLAELFKDKPEKITIWWLTENLNLGGTTPAWFYTMRPEKFEKWFKSLIEVGEL